MSKYIYTVLCNTTHILDFRFNLTCVYRVDTQASSNIQSNVPNYCISDHFPVLFSRTLKNKPVKGCHEHIKYRSFKNFNEQQFHRDLMFSELHNVETINNPEKGLGIFYDILTSILDKHAPIKEKRIKYDKQPEWLTNEIK